MANQQSRRHLGDGQILRCRERLHVLLRLRAGRRRVQLHRGQRRRHVHVRRPPQLRRLSRHTRHLRALAEPGRIPDPLLRPHPPRSRHPHQRDQGRHLGALHRVRYRLRRGACEVGIAASFSSSSFGRLIHGAEKMRQTRPRFDIASDDESLGRLPVLVYLT